MWVLQYISISSVYSEQVYGTELTFKHPRIRIYMLRSQDVKKKAVLCMRRFSGCQSWRNLISSSLCGWVIAFTQDIWSLSGNRAFLWHICIRGCNHVVLSKDARIDNIDLLLILSVLLKSTLFPVSTLVKIPYSFRIIKMKGCCSFDCITFHGRFEYESVHFPTNMPAFTISSSLSLSLTISLSYRIQLTTKFTSHYDDNSYGTYQRPSIMLFTMIV